MRKPLPVDHGEGNSLSKAHAVARVGVVPGLDLDHRVIVCFIEGRCFRAIAIHAGFSFPLWSDPDGDEPGTVTILGRLDNLVNAKRPVEG